MGKLCECCYTVINVVVKESRVILKYIISIKDYNNTWITHTHTHTLVFGVHRGPWKIHTNNRTTRTRMSDIVRGIVDFAHLTWGTTICVWYLIDELWTYRVHVIFMLYLAHSHMHACRMSNHVHYLPNPRTSTFGGADHGLNQGCQNKVLVFRQIHTHTHITLYSHNIALIQKKYMCEGNGEWSTQACQMTLQLYGLHLDIQM